MSPSTSTDHLAAALEHTRQHGFAYRFEWGLDGLAALAPVSDVVVIVDVLRFSTAVSAAADAGVVIVPAAWHAGEDGSPAGAATHDGAIVAGRREHGRPSLSPTDMLSMPRGARVVLPSPNGATLTAQARDAGARHVLVGSLRNATATARRAHDLAGDHGVVAVIAAGERWHDAHGPVRHAVEDLLGAGAILAALDPASAVAAPQCSPEAAAARAAFLAARPLLHDVLAGSASGRQLIARGWDDDVVTSAAYDVSDVPVELRHGELVASRA